MKGSNPQVNRKQMRWALWMDALAYCFEKVSRFWLRKGKLGGDQWPPSGQWGVWRGQGSYWSTGEEDLHRERTLRFSEGPFPSASSTNQCTCVKRIVEAGERTGLRFTGNNTWAWDSTCSQRLFGTHKGFWEKLILDRIVLVLPNKA